jgi:AraC-like DNA-binding protein
LDVLGLPAGRSLAIAGLNDELLERRDSWMPMHQFGVFLNDLVLRFGCWELGQVSSMLPRSAHSKFSRKVLHAPTLHQSLASVCRYSFQEDTSAHFKVIHNSRGIWMDCGSLSGSPEAIYQIEMYRLGALVKLIRDYAGTEWLPTEINLQSQASHSIRDNPLLNIGNVHFESRRLSFLVDAKLLPISSLRYNSLGNILDTIESPELGCYSVNAFADDLEAVMASRMGCGAISIYAIASAFGISPRSLQRELSRLGTSYSELLDRLRIDRAKEMLAETDLTQVEISRELGYGHSANFSRAFKRVCGISPKQYRQKRPEIAV